VIPKHRHRLNKFVDQDSLLRVLCRLPKTGQVDGLQKPHHCLEAATQVILNRLRDFLSLRLRPDSLNLLG
jgi:hypothetical protein